MSAHRDRGIGWLDVSWWAGTVVTLVIADFALVLGALFWVPALSGVTDQCTLFACCDMACVYRGYAIGFISFAGTVALFGVVVPLLAPSAGDLRWASLLSYVLIGVGVLATASTWASVDGYYVWTIPTTACLVVLAVGCHVWLRLRGETLLTRAGGRPR